MDSKFLNLLGLCKKAGKMSGGHDAAFESISKGKAAVCFLTQDASDRLKDEFRNTAVYDGRKLNLVELKYTMFDINLATGSKTAVFTVNDAGFAKKLLELLKED